MRYSRVMTDYSPDSSIKLYGFLVVLMVAFAIGVAGFASTLHYFVQKPGETVVLLGTVTTVVSDGFVMRDERGTEVMVSLVAGVRLRKGFKTIDDGISVGTHVIVAGRLDPSGRFVATVLRVLKNPRERPRL